MSSSRQMRLLIPARPWAAPKLHPPAPAERQTPCAGHTRGDMRISLPVVGCLAAVMLETAAPVAQVNIFTHRYDGPRTGANLAETALTAANVNVSRFGKL
jgi:hypothetical protein